MKFYKLLICIIGISIGVFPSLYAQDLPTLPVIPSPQTWDFMAYGRVPVGLHTGQLDLEIPLYHYKDRDFDIPITLAYNSAGFTPSKPAGPVGLNWFLNYGGVITRQVVGYPDDTHPSSIEPIVGLFFRAYDQNASQSVSTNDVWSFAPPTQPIQFRERENYCLEQSSLFPINNGNNYYETTPDIFSFNFLGHRGKFVGDPTGKIHIYDCEGSGTYQVDISEAIILPGKPYNPYYSKIVVTTGDGYKYTFGGDDSSYEYINQTGRPEILSADDHNSVIVSWYLSKIEAPNGREVNFEYEEYANYGPISKPTHFVITETPAEEKGYQVKRISASMIEFENQGGYNINTPISQCLKTVYIKNISIDSIKITFSNTYRESRDTESYYSIASPQLDLTGYSTMKLDAMSVSGPNGVLKTIKFGFGYYLNSIPPLNAYLYSPQANRMFLDSLSINNNEVYYFDYNRKENLPDPLTRSVDYWGFWNGGNTPNYNFADSPTNPSMIPNFDRDIFHTTGDIIYQPGNSREPSTTQGVFDAALLNKIIYPTGGSTIITYEPHDYSKRLERRDTTSFLPHLFNVMRNGGGARVKILKDIDADGTIVNQREFNYKNSNNKSSGVLENWPIMAKRDTLLDMASFRYHVIMQSSGFSINCLDDGYIRYAEVKESYPDNSYTTYRFSTYDDKPDDAVNNNSQYTKSLSNPRLIVLPSKFYRNITRMPNSRAQERGKLSEKIHHNNYGTPISKELYSYSNICPDLVAGTSFCGDIFYSYLIHAGSILPETIIQTIYDPNGFNSVTTTTYSYNALGLRSKESQTQSDNSVINTYTRYVSDLDNTSLLPIPTSPAGNSIAVEGTVSTGFTRLNSSMPGVPVEQAVYKKPAGGNEVFISAAATFFKPSIFKSDVALPYQQLTLHASTSTSTGIADYHPLEKNGNNYKYDKRMALEVTYDSYDNYDNVTQYTGRDGLPVSYLWGYKGLYPIAKIVGASYSEVSSGLGIHDYLLAENNLSMMNIKPMIEQLKSNLPDAQISGYSYIPLVGLSAEIAPNGLMTSYKYDTFGRLRHIMDHRDKIIESYEYHYQGQPIDNTELLESNSWVRTNISRCDTIPGSMKGNVLVKEKEYDKDGNETGEERWTNIVGATCSLDPARYSYEDTYNYDWGANICTITFKRTYDDGRDPTYRITASNGVSSFVYAVPRFSHGSFIFDGNQSGGFYISNIEVIFN